MRKRINHFILLFLVASVLIFSSERTASAFESADGRIHVTGWLENLTSMRLDDGPDDGVHEVNKSGRIQNFRNTLQVETTVKPIPEVTFYVNLRGFYEGSWGAFDQTGFDNSPRKQDAVPRGEPMEKDLDLREYHVMARLGDFTFKIGRQQVVWGESDALRMADIINPLDFSAHWVFENWEDIRIPLRMVNLMWEPPSEHQFRAQLIYIPEDFRPAAFSFPGGPWAIPGVPEIVWKQMNRELPDKHEFSNGQVGGRVQGKLGDWDLSLFHYYHRVDAAVYSVDFTHAPIPLNFRWPYVNTIGGTFNTNSEFTTSILRGEFAFTLDQPYTSTSQTIPGLPDDIIEKNTFAYMLGFDRPTWIKFLNPTKTFFISGQWFAKYILNTHAGDLLTTDMGTDKKQNIISLLINTQYHQDRIVPQILVVHDFSGGNGGNGFVQPSIKYQPNENWEFILAANFISGKENDDGYFGAVRKSDEVYLRVRLKF